MTLSNQALGAIMMALQKSIMEQSDIVPVLQGFEFVETTEGLTVQNPPAFQVKNTDFNKQKEDGTLRLTRNSNAEICLSLQRMRKRI